MEISEVTQKVEQFQSHYTRITDEIKKIMVGQENIIQEVMICLLAGGHVLLEGVPGLGKTMLVRTLGECMSLAFSRIQFTPDLMPADIVGTNIIMDQPDGSKAFQFQRGPVFTNLLLADEINRATPKTQSALLEAMQEHRVTVAGTTYTLDEPFFVLATQNPLEMEGTYPLPEAQLDRFLFKSIVEFPSLDELGLIIDRTTGGTPIDLQPVADASVIDEMRALSRDIVIASHVRDYTLRLILATHPDSEHATDMTKKYVRYGSSPRGGQTIILAAKIMALLNKRYNVSYDDIQQVAYPALRHRLILNFEGEAEGISTDAIIESLLKNVPRDMPATV